MLKALFVLKIFKFLSCLLVMQEKRLEQKDRLILKLRRHNLIKKLLQYTYCHISHEISQPDNGIW